MKAKGRLDCDICGYKATRILLLILHKESEHEGVRYVCDICNFKTIKESFLIFHKQVQHEGRRFDCNGCDFQAKSRGKIKNIATGETLPAITSLAISSLDNFHHSITFITR